MTVSNVKIIGTEGINLIIVDRQMAKEYIFRHLQFKLGTKLPVLGQERD